MLIGLLAGAVAAIIAALISLPLESPDDAFLNTASVVLGALIAGAAAGALRAMLPLRTFIVVWGAAFVVTSLALLLVPLDGMLAFGVPLAAVVFLITGAAVATVEPDTVPRLPIAAAGTAIVALGLGLGLAGQGDAESGALALPPAPVAAGPAAGTPAGTGTPAATATAAATAARGADGLPTQFATQADLKDVTFVVGQGSQATFTVNEKLAQLPLPNDAVMRSNALTGDIRLDGRPSTITLDLMQLSSDQDRRDQFMRRIFQRQPAAVLTIPALTGLPERYTAGQVVKQTVKGTLAINGIEAPVTFEVEARMDGTVLNVLGKTSFVWKDFNMNAPATPAVSVQDKVNAEVLLVAKPKAG